MRKLAVTCLVMMTIFIISGCNSQKEEISVLATTDLHGNIPYELSSYVANERKKDDNLTIVDAGDFFDSEEFGEMSKFFQERIENPDKHIEMPMVKKMKKIGYETVVLGNHEFISNNKKFLDNIISDFNKYNIDVLSANTYKKNGENYTEPYIIKEIKTQSGTVKLGILGLTIKEVGESQNWIDDGTQAGKLVKAKSRELKDQEGYNGELYMNDLVDDANKWVAKMKDNNADIIVAVVHSGEKPKKPKNPGNRIQEIAEKVDGIDAIVAGHTHKQIEQHDYENKSGENVIVTQPGKHGECISKINFNIKKKGNGWEVIDKNSSIVKFDFTDIENENKNIEKLMMYLYENENKPKEIKRLSDITSFEWDNAYIFAPDTPREIIYEKVGYEWRDITETNGAQIVFMKDDKPVGYIPGYADVSGVEIDLNESEYKNKIATIKSGKNDKFILERKKMMTFFDYERTVTHFVHIE